MYQYDGRQSKNEKNKTKCYEPPHSLPDRSGPTTIYISFFLSFHHFPLNHKDVSNAISINSRAVTCTWLPSPSSEKTARA